MLAACLRGPEPKGEPLQKADDIYQERPPRQIYVSAEKGVQNSKGWKVGPEMGIRSHELKAKLYHESGIS